MKTASIPSLAAFHDHVGTEMAVSDWVRIEQDRIDLFAEASGDRQWIHVDVDRASARSAFGGTIAHGFLTLSLLPLLFESTVTLPAGGMGVNYGLDKVRFTHPVRAGERVRARFTLVSCDDLDPGVHLKWTVCVEIENRDKPACVIEWLTRRYP